MTVNVQDLTVPELYRLAWEVSERLVALEMQRLQEEADRAGEAFRARLARPAVALAGFDNEEDNYGCW